ncbi:PTS sugar transporter subunit IIA [Sodalis-like endosymbiont of Proechinophthirus fluctus]|uniref:PTS sugar transporter subunit IIA n=1 Tax=Sodalis-like endosymbiont of Proechinophthirus fluctus TaxID=1462730 RepID=UPI00164F953B|nr:PTS sugar transporter subunit IIA [Sodalis-like endosymbiont of Proechinophthirus fluctus]
MLAELLQKYGAVKNSEWFIYDIYQRERKGKTSGSGYIAIHHVNPILSPIPVLP